MSENSSKKEIITLMWKLGIICIIVAGLLAWINSLTAPVIEKNDVIKFEQAMAEVLPGASEFQKKDIDFIPNETGVTVDSFYTAGDSGFVVTTVCSEGYGGDIKVMVGINSDETVNRIKILSLSETAGLGAKADSDDFTAPYGGLKNNIGVEKNNGGSHETNTISAISGATVTSKAVTKAVNCALDAVADGGGK